MLKDRNSNKEINSDLFFIDEIKGLLEKGDVCTAKQFLDDWEQELIQQSEKRNAPHAAPGAR